MRYFKMTEFKMGDQLVFDKMDSDLLILLDELREAVDEPLHITSSYRSPEYNASVGGAPNSYHKKGKAVDLSCSNSTLRAKIVYHALELGLTVGVAKSFIHVDNRDSQILFSYGNN